MLDHLNHRIPNVLLQRRYHLLRHVLILVVMLLITVNVLWDEPVRIRSDRFGVWAIYCSLFAAMVYTNMYVLVPRYLLKGKVKKYLGLAGAITLFFIFSLGMLQGVAEDDGPVGSTPAVIGITSSVAAFALFILGLTTLQLAKYRIVNKRKIHELERATLAVELDNLQHQINPHFLFNMLNNANIMAGEDAGASSDMLLRLNELLRYQVNAGSEETVSLAADIAFLNDYLALEKMRRDRFHYTIRQEGRMDIEVPPLLFIPFVENAVKHNPENGSEVNIVFRTTANKVSFECRNPKARRPQERSPGGIGLENVRRRLDLLFKGKHRLYLDDEATHYTVLMEIML